MATSNTPLFGQDHFISLEQARAMTVLFRNEKENILIPELRGKDILSICETFNRDAFDALLAVPGCAGIRIYFGMEPDKKVKVIAVAVDQKGSDILPSEGNAALTSDGKIVEVGQSCPPWCPPPGGL